LTHRGVGAVIQQEADAVDALLGDGIHLMNQDARGGFVGHGERGGFAVLDGEILRGFVDLEALSGLDFHRIVVPGVQVHVDPARGIRNDGFHQSAVHSADFKLDVGNALGFVALADLDQFESSHGSIVEGQNLTLAFLDLNGLRCAVQHEPVHRGGFLRGDDRARFQIGENNAAKNSRSHRRIEVPRSDGVGGADE